MLRELVTADGRDQEAAAHESFDGIAGGLLVLPEVAPDLAKVEQRPDKGRVAFVLTVAECAQDRLLRLTGWLAGRRTQALVMCHDAGSDRFVRVVILSDGHRFKPEGHWCDGR